MKKKTTVFRPAIPDENGVLRARFSEVLKQTEFTRSAFAYKVIEAGVQAVADGIKKQDK